MGQSLRRVCLAYMGSVLFGIVLAATFSLLECGIGLFIMELGHHVPFVLMGTSQMCLMRVDCTSNTFPPLLVSTRVEEEINSWKWGGVLCPILTLQGRKTKKAVL